MQLIIRDLIYRSPLNKPSRLSDLGIPLHTGIKPFPFKLCIEKHRTAETLKPETRNFRPIRKQLVSRKNRFSAKDLRPLHRSSGETGTRPSSRRLFSRTDTAGTGRQEEEFRAATAAGKAANLAGTHSAIEPALRRRK